MDDSLKTYRKKRNFEKTSEPADGGESAEDARSFVIQKHWARSLHYDFRLELAGAMKSWAVPKGPSYDPKVKRMAVQVEDHPIAYNRFEGQIPKGEYGAGKVIIWDKGTWTPIGDPGQAYRAGHLKFELHGVKMKGRWALIRMKGKESDKQAAWLLIKEADSYARPESAFSVVDEMPESVAATPAAKSQSLRPAAKRTAAAARKADAGIPGKAAALPALLKPQLATLVDSVPSQTEDWLYEVKFDGYRLLARIDGGSVRLFTRNGHDWSAKLPHLVKAFLAFPVRSEWIDGEIVLMADNGVPSFQALQGAFSENHTEDIVFYAFDMPYVAGRDLRLEPLHLRRALLAQLIAAADDEHLRFSEAFDAAPGDLVASACNMGLEGIMAKRQSAPYVSRRTDTWVKIKCGQRQEFVVLGCTQPKGKRAGFGALLLGVHDADGRLHYAGRVGTGFDDHTLTTLKKQLDALKTAEKPVTTSTGGGAVQWVKPELIVEVSFSEWTAAGQIRHAVFQGLRQDKPARDITREKSRAPRADQDKTAKAPSIDSQTTRKSAGRLSSKLSNPDRVIDASTGLTKLDLARYYGLVAPLLLVHLKDRPVSFLRAPRGIEAQQFFQKHLDAAMPGVKALPARLDPDHPPLLEISTLEGVMSAAQMNVVEFHTWNAIKTSIAKPDRMVFDLDPGEGVTWTALQQGAQLVHVLLQEIGLNAWLKTSGGKGLHVIVPLRKQYDWETIKSFSQAIVQHLAQALPQNFVAKSGPKNRIGKIFVDYLRNGFGATTVAAWSARARPGMGVSVPLAWDELSRITSSAQWTIANIHARLDAGNEPWADYAPQGISRAMAAMSFRPGR